MGLQLAGQWVWDFWLVQDAGRWHVFYLHAPQTPDDPDMRHFAATIGHARSADLRSWEVLADVIGHGPAGSWDDLATWTGSVVADPGGGWAMLYTGVSTQERGLVQRIGLARSDDLHDWVKHPANPVLEADSQWYEILDLGTWFDQAWRDPWLVHDPDSGLLHAFVTARNRDGPARARGVVAHATSFDFENWDVGPPIHGPQGFGYLEIPQVFTMDGRWHMLFSAPGWAQTARNRPNCTGTFHALADQLAGPYREIAPLFCTESLYGGKVVMTDGDLACLAFRNRDPNGGFVGELTDPMPVRLAADGTLTLVESHPY